MVHYLLSLWEQGISVVAICRQYHVPSSTFYYWLSRYQAHGTCENLSRAPHMTHLKVTADIKTAVIKNHKENPRLGCWRLSLFDYEGQHLSAVTIWQLLQEVKPQKFPSLPLYIITRFHQIWFIDHLHLRTLPSGQKVYSLIIVDGMSRVLLADEICLSKGARDACLILIRAFARWGLPEAMVSDNAKAFTSLLYTLLLGKLEVRVRHITPGCPWENPFAESLVGTMKAYLYPHVQHQKTVASVRRVYAQKVDYYNHRVHWAFRDDEVKTPLGKLENRTGRQMPQEFSLELLATGKRYQRIADGQGRISFHRYRLYVRVELAKQKVEIREFFTSWVVVYQSGAVVTYRYGHEPSEAEIMKRLNTPVFHDHAGIKKSRQLELLEIPPDHKGMRYVTRRPPHRKRPRFPIDATQLRIEAFA